MTRPTGAAALGLLLASVSFAAAAEEAGETLLLRQPTLSREHLAFIYGGDVWVTDRDGQHPHRLTAQASAFSPHFSPDGQSIAYSASYAGNVDVYVIPAAGGQPRRLTFHPARDVVNGWSIDGERIRSRALHGYVVGLGQFGVGLLFIAQFSLAGYLAAVLVSLDPTGDAFYPYRLVAFAGMLGRNGSVRFSSPALVQPFGRLFAVSISDAQFSIYEPRMVARLRGGLESLSQDGRQEPVPSGRRGNS